MAWPRATIIAMTKPFTGQLVIVSFLLVAAIFVFGLDRITLNNEGGGTFNFAARNSGGVRRPALFGLGLLRSFT